jgi:hypothetical protein
VKKEFGKDPNDVLVRGGCETTYYCSKECQKLHMKSHKVSPFSNLQSQKVKCEEMIAAREFVMQMCGSDLPLKVNRWTEDYVDQIRFLLLTTFYTVDRNRFKKYVVFITMDEVKQGFRVVSATEILIESLPDDLIQVIRKSYSDFSKESSDVHCTDCDVQC